MEDFSWAGAQQCTSDADPLAPKVWILQPREGKLFLAGDPV